MTILALGSFLAYPAKQAFAPANWDAALTVDLAAGLRSKKIELSWDTDYGPFCSPTHVMLRYNKLTGGTASSPSASDHKDGTYFKTLPSSTSLTNHNLLHANTSYAYTIYACNDSLCNTYCPGVDNVSNEVPTDKEKWLVTGVNDYDEDTDVRILDPGDWENQACPELYRFDTGTYNGKAGLFFTAYDATSSLPQGVWVVHTADTTWQSDWNATNEWGTPVLVASGTSGGDYDNPKNIMVVPSVDPSDNHRMRLLWTSYDDKDNPTYYTLNSAVAVDVDGDDYGLCCTDSEECSSTDYCDIEEYDDVCCDFEGGSAIVRQEYEALDGNCLAPIGWHGHDLWDDMGPDWDPDSDELALLFSADPYNVGTDCDDCDPEPGVNGKGSDIDMWYWDTGGGCDTGDLDTAAKFCLEEEEEDTSNPPAGTDWCPKEVVLDAHDPFSVSFVNEKKVYWKVEQSAWIVGYTTDNGRTFEDTSAIEFYFEDDDTPDTGGMDSDDLLDAGCVEDPASMIWKDGGSTNEMMVFVAVPGERDPDHGDDFRCFCTQDPLVDTEDSEFESYPGLLGAYLRNG